MLYICFMCLTSFSTTRCRFHEEKKLSRLGLMPPSLSYRSFPDEPTSPWKVPETEKIEFLSTWETQVSFHLRASELEAPQAQPFCLSLRMHSQAWKRPVPLRFTHGPLTYFGHLHWLADWGSAKDGTPEMEQLTGAKAKSQSTRIWMHRDSTYSHRKC